MNLFKKFKNLFSKNDLKYVLKEKDIIWTKRYNTLEEKESIEDGHQVGPCVVFKIKRNKIYILECGSSLPKKDIFKYKLLSTIYNLDKTTYIYLGKMNILTKNRYIKTLDTLNDIDYVNLKKSLYLFIKYIRKVKHLKLKDLKFDISIGDIIKYDNGLFYIYKLDEDNFYCYKVYLIKKEIQYCIYVNDSLYSFNFIKPCILNKDIKYEFVNYANIEKQNLINLYKIKFIKAYERKDIIERGKVIKYNNELFYIYSVYKNNLITFKLLKKYNSKCIEVIIDYKKYYTNLKDKIIYKDDNIKILCYASEEEMDNIRELKKEKNDKEKERKERLIRQKKSFVEFKEYVPVRLICNKYTLDKFVIAKRNNDRLTLLPYPEMDKIVLYQLPDDNIDYNLLDKLSDLEYKNLLIKLKNNKLLKNIKSVILTLISLY